MGHCYVYTLALDNAYIARLMGSLHRKAQLFEGHDDVLALQQPPHGCIVVEAVQFPVHALMHT
jgi:hypothetical protein